MLSGYWTALLTTAGINAIIATGLYFSNSAGALSVAHAALAGIGAYASAVLTVKFGIPFPIAIAVGAVAGTLAGVFLAWITLRMNPLVAGLTTLAFGETMVVVAFNWDYIGGARSFTGIPLQTEIWHVYGFLLLVVILGWRFEKSLFGLAAYATRHAPVAADALGVNVPRVKVAVFAIGAAIAAIAGAFRAHYVLVLNPADLAFWVSVNYVIFWVLGGSYSFVGPAVGAMILTILPEVLRFSTQDRFILYGVALISLVILRPSGLIPRLPRGQRLSSWVTNVLNPRRPPARFK